MGKAAFTQADVQRLLRAAKREGYPHPTVDKLPGGGLRLLTEPPASPAPSAPGDGELDAELAEWDRKNGYG